MKDRTRGGLERPWRAPVLTVYHGAGAYTSGSPKV